MKLLLINGNTDPAITARLRHFAEAALPRLGLTAELHAVTARFGARYIASRASAAIAGHAVLDALAEHGTGMDGIIIACFGDPGLDAAKELAGVPLVGMAEASLVVARAAERRIGFITGGAAWVPMLEEFCLSRGLPAEQVLVRAVAPDGARIAADPEGAVAELAEAVRGAARDGAEAVVLGGAGLAGLAPAVAAASGVAVLDSLDCALLAVMQAAVPPRPAGVTTVGLSAGLETWMSATESRP